VPDRWYQHGRRADDRVQHETGLRLHVARGSLKKTWSWSSTKAFHDPTPGPSCEGNYLGRMGDRLLIFSLATFVKWLLCYVNVCLPSSVVSFLYPLEVFCHPLRCHWSFIDFIENGQADFQGCRGWLIRWRCRGRCIWASFQKASSHCVEQGRRDCFESLSRCDWLNVAFLGSNIFWTYSPHWFGKI